MAYTVVSTRLLAPSRLKRQPALPCFASAWLRLRHVRLEVPNTSRPVAAALKSPTFGRTVLGRAKPNHQDAGLRAIPFRRPMRPPPAEQ